MSIVKIDLASSEPVVGMEAKALFNKVLTVADLALHWEDEALDVFKKMNIDFRKFEISGSQFFDYLQRTFKPHIVVQLLPDLVRLLPDVEQRTELVELQDQMFSSWHILERKELELMQKEEIRQQEIEAENKEIAVYSVGDYVTCQFKRIGGTKYNGTVTHVYTQERAAELQKQLDEAKTKLLKIFQMVDKRLISRIQAIKAAMNKKNGEITSEMTNKDDAITLRLRKLEPELAAVTTELLAQEEAGLQLSQKVAELKALIERKAAVVEEAKSEIPVDKKKIKKLASGLRKASKEQDIITTKKTETYALITQLQEKQERHKQMKRIVELESELAQKTAELMDKPKEYVKLQIRNLESTISVIQTELKLTLTRLTEARSKLDTREEVERAYDVAEGRPDEDEDDEAVEALIFDLKEYVRGAPHDLEVHEAKEGVVEAGVCAQQMVVVDKVWELIESALQPGADTTEFRTYLINEPLKARQKGEHGNTPLHIATKAGHEEICQFLVQKAVNLDTTGQDDDTALHIAARGSSARLTEMLLEGPDGVSGANANCRNRMGHTPLMLACAAVATGGDTSKVTDQIEEIGAELAKLKKKPKKKRKKEDNARLEELEEVLQKLHADFLVEAEKERCDQDQLLVVQTLLMYDAALEMRDQNGATALLQAAECNVKIFELLLFRGGRSEVRDNMHEGVMHHAAAHNSVRVVESFLKTDLSQVRSDQEQATIRDMRNKFGETPLFVAARNGALEATRLLISMNSDLDAINTAGFTPLLRAAGQGHVDVVKLLVDEGADMEALTPFEAITPQLWAAKAQQHKVVLYFEKARKERKKGCLTYQKRAKEAARVRAEKYAPKALTAAAEDTDDKKGKGKKSKKKRK